MTTTTLIGTQRTPTSHASIQSGKAPISVRWHICHFDLLAARAAAKIAIAEALLDAGGDRDGDAARASDGLRGAVRAPFRNAQQAGAVRREVELPEVYALLVGVS